MTAGKLLAGKRRPRNPSEWGSVTAYRHPVGLEHSNWHGMLSLPG